MVNKKNWALKAVVSHLCAGDQKWKMEFRTVLKCTLFSVEGNFSVNIKDWDALILLGPTRKNLVSDPLAVNYLNQPLYINSTIKYQL